MRASVWLVVWLVGFVSACSDDPSVAGPADVGEGDQDVTHDLPQDETFDFAQDTARDEGDADDADDSGDGASDISEAPDEDAGDAFEDAGDASGDADGAFGDADYADAAPDSAADVLDGTDAGDLFPDASLDAGASPDASDPCPGSDETVDLNHDGVPDCAQNLLPNGGFDGTLTPWQLAEYEPARDANGRSTSGSARLSFSEGDEGTPVVAHCQRFEPGLYGLYAQGFVASGQATEADAGAVVYGFGDSSCGTMGGEPEELLQTFVDTPTDSWTTVSGRFAVSAERPWVVVYLTLRPATNADVVGYLDNALAISEDADGDLVPDIDDLCPGADDRVDLDDDGVPDCSQNLLRNGGFDGTLAPWSGAGSSHDAGSDAGERSMSGSALLTHSGGSEPGAMALVQCVEVPRGGVHLLLLEYLIASAQASGGSVELRVTTWQGARCGADTDETGEVVFDDVIGDVTDAWVRAEAQVSLGTGTPSVEVRLGLAPDNPAADFEARVDNVLLVSIDADADGVEDDTDLCAGQNDAVDLDDNGVPDCIESLVENGGFDGGLDGWNVFGGVGSYAPERDSYDLATSGALSISHTTDGPGSVETCVNVVPGRKHAIYLQYLLESGQATRAAPTVAVIRYDEADCPLGSATISTAITFGNEQDAWTVGSSPLELGDDVVSVRLSLRMAREDDSQPFTGFVDNVAVFMVDDDGDTVVDADDVCPGGDDRVDLNGDGTPDCTQNLVTNGGFDGGIDTWSSLGGGGAYAPERDANAMPTSGGLEISAQPGLPSGVETCVNLADDGEHDLYLQYFLESGQDTVGFPFVAVIRYTEPDCPLEATTSSTGISLGDVQDAWTTEARLLGGTLGIGEGTQSVRLSLRMERDDDSQPFTGYVDNVLVLPSTDSDGDGVLDLEDQCPGSNDLVDLDANSSPDCVGNLIVNGFFDGGLWGWWDNPQWRYDGEDAQGLATSGTARGDVSSLGNTLVQCVPTDGDGPHRLLYQYRIPLDVPNVEVLVSAVLHRRADCTELIGPDYVHDGPVGIGRGAYQTVQDDFDPPDGTAALLINVVVRGVGPDDYPVRAYIDNLSLHPL